MSLLYFVKGIIVIAPSLGFGGILLYSIYAQRASLNTIRQFTLFFLSYIVTWYQSLSSIRSSTLRLRCAAPGSIDLLLGAASPSSPKPIFLSS